MTRPTVLARRGSLRARLFRYVLRSVKDTGPIVATT